MKTVALTTLVLILLALLGAAAFVYAGVFNVAADEPHSGFIGSVMETARVRSIKAHAAGIVVPGGYDSEANVVSAVEHFAEHCARCHGAPGVKPNEIADGMYPRPPSLTHVRERYTSGEIFWILKHGIKMSGMPSMADDGDAMLWSTVALLEQLPRMSDEDYHDLLTKAQAQVGTHDMDMGGMAMHGTGEAEKQHE